MNTYHSFTQLKKLSAPVHWAIGFFDGVHEGHRRVIQSANTPGAMRGVLTFVPHPMALLRPDSAPLLLTPQAELKHRLLADLGVEVLLELPFTKELAALSPEAFIEQLCNACTVAGISVGDNWHFGKGGVGNADFIKKEAAKRGFRACISDMLMMEKDTVCSTRIRALLGEGNMDKTTQMLGRPFSIFGTVEHGQKLARKLGFPTANIALPASAALPCPGVYSVSATIKGQLCHGIANVGLRPTIQENIKITRLEAHFTDWNNGDFYGESIEVFLHSFIRKEQKFSSIEALKAQIKEDLNHLKH